MLPLKCKSLPDPETAMEWNQLIAAENTGQFIYINKIKLLK